MPRRARLELPDVPLHVTQRGVNRGAIFVDDEDRRHFLDLLHDAVRAHALHVHAYVMMDNHIHLLLTSHEAGALSAAMRRLGQCYVRAFNQRHRRVGPLWQGRFKSCLVESEAYLMTAYRYIELNPVRAAMVAHAEDHPWSSVHANLGTRRDPLVTPHPLFLALHENPGRRAALYRAWLREGVADDDLAALRAHLDQQRALGSPGFQAMVERTLGRPARVRPRGRPRLEEGEEGDVSN